MRPDSRLGAVARQLKVPPWRRLELIEELGADAEALQEELEHRGYDTRAARRMAAGQIVPSRQTLAQLEAQNEPRLGRWLRKLGLAGAINRLGALATAILAGSAVLAALWWQDPGVAGNLLAWSQGAVVALLSSNWARAARRLWIDGDLRPGLRQVLWARQVGLIVAAVSLAGLGAAWKDTSRSERLKRRRARSGTRFSASSSSESSGSLLRRSACWAGWPSSPAS